MPVSPIAPQAPSPSLPQRSLSDPTRHEAAVSTGASARSHAATPQGGGDEVVTGAHDAALVRKLLAQVPRADRQAAQTAIPAILEAAHSVGTADPNRVGYLLATAQTESDFGANMTETGHSAAWFNAAYGGIDGNRPGSSDGYVYRGRGYVQTTRAGRYAEISRALHLPEVPANEASGKNHLGRCGKLEPQLVAHPEMLAEPRLAARALVVGVVRNLFTHNPAAALDKTIPTGKPPGEVDFYHARGIVNGIVHDQALTIAQHATAYARVLADVHQTPSEVARETPSGIARTK